MCLSQLGLRLLLYPLCNFCSLKPPIIPNSESGNFAFVGQTIDCTFVDLEVLGYLFDRQDLAFHGNFQAEDRVKSVNIVQSRAF